MREVYYSMELLSRLKFIVVWWILEGINLPKKKRFCFS